ncbi:MAG TPA: CBS domain-containing protein [Anaerolineales bacterium]|nr:CBS domain-containing protein [Anaerolineales bacterium]
MAKLVRDLMHRGIHTCRPDATLGQVAVLLNQHHVHALIVADGAGRALGIISDFDLLAGEWLSSDSESLATMRRLTASDLMSHPVDSVETNIPLSEAVNQLIEKEIGRLLVTENGKPVGVISLSDFVSSIAQQERPSREVVGDVMSDAILVCRGKTPVLSAARAMTAAGWRSVLVVDARGKTLGVVSGWDLLPFVKNGLDENLIVRDVMHPALTIDIHASLREAADMMIQHHHHRLVVIDREDPDAFPLGAISSFDIVARMAHPKSAWQTTT